MYRLDRKTHHSLIEPVSESMHLKVMLISRFVAFAHKALNSKKFCVRFVANCSMSDNRTIFGRNVLHIKQLCEDEDFSSISPKMIKSNCKYWTDECEPWRTNLVSELLSVRSGDLEVEGFSRTQMIEMLTDACVN